MKIFESFTLKFYLPTGAEIASVQNIAFNADYVPFSNEISITGVYRHPRKEDGLCHMRCTVPVWEGLQHVPVVRASDKNIQLDWVHKESLYMYIPVVLFWLPPCVKITLPNDRDINVVILEIGQKGKRIEIELKNGWSKNFERAIEALHATHWNLWLAEYDSDCPVSHDKVHEALVPILPTIGKVIEPTA